MLTRIYVVDGSGDKNRRQAERKRPIYELDLQSMSIRRLLPSKGQSTREVFQSALAELSHDESALIAADVPIGIPAEPRDVYESIGETDFIGWLEAIASSHSGREQGAEFNWRDELIANGVANRSATQPFVSLGKGEKRGGWDGKRQCDLAAGAESIYCVDHGAKQVGKAALQFWWEVMIPIRQQHAGETAIWPFEDPQQARITFAECYPALCHRHVFGSGVSKRNPIAVATALIDLQSQNELTVGVETPTWIHAASSEDEFDMFTTAIAMASFAQSGKDLFACPDSDSIREIEGWIIGLDQNAL